MKKDGRFARPCEGKEHDLLLGARWGGGDDCAKTGGEFFFLRVLRPNQREKKGVRLSTESLLIFQRVYMFWREKVVGRKLPVVLKRRRGFNQHHSKSGPSRQLLMGEKKKVDLVCY